MDLVLDRKAQTFQLANIHFAGLEAGELQKILASPRGRYLEFWRFPVIIMHPTVDREVVLAMGFSR